jgi:CRP-like cAMP-binding protein
MSEGPTVLDLPVFACVDEATLTRLLLDAKVEHLADGDVIFRQGDQATAVVMVLRGFVKLLRIASCGDETLISIRCDGESVNDPPTSSEETYPISAEAVGPTTVVKLPAARFMRLIAESPKLATAMILDGKKKINALFHEIESLKAQSADQRLVRFILSLCPTDEDQCCFRLPYDKRLIAARLGVKQETLSRAFAKLRDLGVRTETREVFVESVARLCAQYDELGRSADKQRGSDSL